MPRRPSLRSRPLRLAVAVGLPVSMLLGACAPHARVYSSDPVDAEGQALETDRVDLLLLEDGVRRGLLPGETLRLEGRAFVIEGPADADGNRPSESVSVTVVEALRARLADGTERWIDVHTPDDLQDYSSLPRIQAIDTADGERIVLGEEGDLVARWSTDRLSILVGPEGDPDPRVISLDTVSRVELHEPDLFRSTLASPAFWIVGAAATGLAIWLAGVGDEDSLATR